MERFRAQQQERVKPLPEKQITSAELRHAFNLPLNAGPLGEPRRSPTAARRQLRDRFKRGRCRAEAGEKLEVSDGSDIVRADQPKPRDLVLGSQAQALDPPTRGSLPAISRSRLPLCFQTMSKPKPRYMMARSKRPNIAAATGATRAAEIPATEE